MDDNGMSFIPLLTMACTTLTYGLFHLLTYINDYEMLTFIACKGSINLNLRF